MSVQVNLYPRFPFDRTRVVEQHTHWPGMTVEDCLPDDWRDGQVIVHVNGEIRPTEAIVFDGAILHVARLPQAGAAASIAGSLITSLANFGGIKAAAAILALQQPRRRGDNESSVYGFDGISNTRTEGQPIMCCYGRIRVGGQILNEFTRVNNSTGEATYYALISYGEGPIKAIGNQEVDTPMAAPLVGDQLSGVYLNGNAFENFNGVRAWVRLGTFEQDPVPGFEETESQEAVNLELDQEDGSGGFLVDPADYNSTATAVQAAWTTYASAYDLDSADYDGARIQIEFPGGLYEIEGSSASLVSRPAYFAIRYIELDGGGSPITTGGDNGDGYVYLPPQVVVRKIQERFFWEYGFAYVDPSLWSVASGLGCEFDGSNDYLEMLPTLPADFGDAFSVAGWVQQDNLSGGDEQVLVSWNTANGFDLGVVDAGGNDARIRLRLKGPNVALDSPSSLAHVHGDWNHVAMVYRKDADGSGVRSVKVYVNGVLVIEEADPTYTIAGGNTWRFGLDTSGLSRYFDGVLDDWTLYSRALSEFDVQLLYNSGQGNRNVSEVDLVGHWIFQGKTGAFWIDRSSFGNDLECKPTAGDTTLVSGKVRNLTGGTALRSKFRIEVLRLDIRNDSSRIQEESIWRNVSGVLDQQFSYPGQAILGIVANGTEQINGSPPTVESDILGRLVPVWTGESATDPQFNMEWSDNPASVAADIILSKSFGAGVYFDGKDIDLPQFLQLAAWAGEFIPDNYPSVASPGTEWTDILYSEGQLFVYFDSAADVPAHWRVNDHVAFFSGFPTSSDDAAILLDLNYDTGDLGKYGLRIVEIAGTIVTLEFPFTQFGLPWTDDSFLVADVGVTAGGTIKGVEPRWGFNAVFDAFGGLWDALQAVLGVAQARPVREGKRITCTIDQARTAVAQVTPASTIVDDSGRSTFSYGYISKKRQPNRVEIDILDARDGFQKRVAAWSDPDIESANAAEVRTAAREGFGITSLSQATRAARFAVLQAKAKRHRGRYRTGPESLHLQPGDVVTVSHDLIPRGESGRLLSATSTTVVQLNRQVVLAPATTYLLQLRDPETNDFETKTVSTAAGTVARGGDITVSSAFSSTPQTGWEWVLYESGTLLQGEVVARSTDAKTLECDVEWEEYVASVYTDLDTLPTDTISEATAPNSQGRPPVGDMTIPGNASRITIRDQVVTDPASGATWREVAVSWSPDSATARIVSETRVYARRQGDGWDLVATADRGEQSATFRLAASFGEVWEVAVQPWSTGGARRSPDNCARKPWAISGRGDAPPPPTGLTATLDGDTAIYSWTLPEGRRDLRVELRRGGPGSWILAPVIGVSARGASELRTADWANAPDNAAGEYPSPTVIARTVSPSGEYSSAVEVSFAPLAIGAEPRVSSGSSYLANAWEDFGDGWTFDSSGPSGNPTLSNLQRNADGDLEFAGSSLSGNYRAGMPSYPAQAAKPERHYIEAVVVAEQIHATAIEDLPAYGIDDPRLVHWTPEGPLTVHSGETGNCTLKIQWRYVDEAGGSWSDWLDYQPCVANVLSAMFRLVVTRPSTDHQVRIKSFRTRITRIAPQRWERSPRQAFLQDRFLRHG